MLFTKSFIQTTRETPNDVDQANPSQVLMTRAGLIKRMSNGLYVHTSLMIGVMDAVMREIKKQMSAVHSTEVKFPVIVSKSDLQESGRWNAFGNEIFKLQDRNKKEIALSPTNEEAACFMAINHIQNRNQLPLCLFQIQKKYRDEIRPHGGVLRTKEFTMKDAYSFHASIECLDDYFLKMQDAYEKIFTNLGLKTVHVTASNGAMGGSGSREFMVLSECGTDTIAICKCGMAFNIEMLEDQNVCTCGNKTTLHKAYELGHIFKLGTYYTDKYKSLNGMQMGCYGIGVERCVSAIIEQHHDANGIKWPEHIAPITHNIITLDMNDKSLVDQSQTLYNEYIQKGVSVLWDDRHVGPGVKLKDSDLLGIPNKIVISKKGVSNEKR